MLQTGTQNYFGIHNVCNVSIGSPSGTTEFTLLASSNLMLLVISRNWEINGRWTLGFLN